MLIISLLFMVSKTTAVFSSLVMPGTGEILLGEKKRGETFLWVGGVTTSLWIGFFWYGELKKTDALLYASLYASANPENKDGRYLSAIENYESSLKYNEEIAREAREKYPNDYKKQQEYIKKYGYFEENEWNWEDTSYWYEYMKIRDIEREAYQRAKLWLGFAVLTRFASVIDCLLFIEKPLRIKTGFDGKRIRIGFSLYFK